jgi:hypothetical protein
MSNRDRTVGVLAKHRPRTQPSGGACACGWAERPYGSALWLENEWERHVTDALVAAGLIHVGQRFCTKVANCRMADGHANGCVRT